MCCNSFSSFGAMTTMLGRDADRRNRMRHDASCRLRPPIRRGLYRGYRKVLGGHIVDDLVVRALEKRRIHGHDGPHAIDSQAGCKGHRMLLGNPHVVQPIRKFFFESIETGTFAHCGRNRDDPRILSGQLNKASIAIAV